MRLDIQQRGVGVGMGGGGAGLLWTCCGRGDGGGGGGTRARARGGEGRGEGKGREAGAARTRAQTWMVEMLQYVVSIVCMCAGPQLHRHSGIQRATHVHVHASCGKGGFF